MSGGGDYSDDLGYGKPPPWGRFKKGRSGNPKGRPKKKRIGEAPLIADASDAVLKQQMEREYPVTENGQSLSLTGIEVIRRAQFKAAVKGSPHAQRLLMADYRDLELRDAAEAERKTHENENAFNEDKRWYEYMKTIWAKAEATGNEPAILWPHPDDFLFDHVAKTCRIRGPIGESDVARFEYLRLERDIGFARATYDHWFRTPRLKAALSLWDPIWMALNALLPKRWQIDDIEREESRIVLVNTPRKLEKAIEADARLAQMMRPLAKLPPSDTESKKRVNDIMKPLLRTCGYHSVAHLEAEYEKSLAT